MQGIWVQSLDGELRTHMAWGPSLKKKKKEKKKQNGAYVTGLTCGLIGHGRYLQQCS